MEKDRWHIVPVNDLKPHNTNSEFCSCQPSVADSGHSVTITHNAYDGREFAEADELAELKRLAAEKAVFPVLKGTST